MSVKPVLKMGLQSLLIKSEPVIQFDSIELRELIQDMTDTMHEKGGVGIAAPQIGYNQRVIMFGFENNPRYPNEKPVPFTILINPEIEILTDEIIEAWEGCLSVPCLRGSVPRYKKIKYKGFDESGKLIEHIADGFHARVVQHELDHINGVLFPLRIKDLRNFGYEDILFEKIYKEKFFTVI